MSTSDPIPPSSPRTTVTFETRIDEIAEAITSAAMAEEHLHRSTLSKIISDHLERERPKLEALLSTDIEPQPDPIYWVTRPGREDDPPAAVLAIQALGESVTAISGEEPETLRGKRGDFYVDADLFVDPGLQRALQAARIMATSAASASPAIRPASSDARGGIWPTPAAGTGTTEHPDIHHLCGIDMLPTSCIGALLTAAADAVTVIETLAKQVEPDDLQSSHWALHRAAALRGAAIAANGGVMPEGSIRDTPEFDEDPEESPFADVGALRSQYQELVERQIADIADRTTKAREWTLDEVRDFARHWVSRTRNGGPIELAADELEGLFAWVRQRMAKDAPAPFDRLTVGVAMDLGLVDGCGTAWALCEAAGWQGA
jgi:hypothetical protein